MHDKTIICHYLSNELPGHESQEVEEDLSNRWSTEPIVSEYKIIWELSALSLVSSKLQFDAEKGWLELQANLSKCDYNRTKNDDNEEINIKDFPSSVREFLKNQ